MHLGREMHLEDHQGKRRMKVILKVNWSDEKSKKKAIKMVSENKDVRGFAVDEENKQLTVDGNMDPVSLVKKMRRQFKTTEIVFMESEASRALLAPPEPNPQDNDNNIYPGYGPYPAYGHPTHHNPYWVSSAPPYWDYYCYYCPQQEYVRGYADFARALALLVLLSSVSLSPAVLYVR